jgi:hypothetical protein
MASSTQTQPSSASRPVRVLIPVSVAYNLDQLTTVLANVARAGGCTGCTSGRDLSFEQISEFVVDPATLEPVPVGV